MSQTLPHLETLLAAHNIKTGKLRETTTRNNNLTFTDDKTVFIKVNQQGRPYNSLIREIKAASIIPNAIKPLYPEHLQLSPNQIATVWEYKTLNPVNLQPDTTQEFVTQLEELHNITLPLLSEEILNPSFINRLSSHVQARIIEAEKRNFSPKHLTQLKEILNTLPPEPDTIYSSKPVLCHNDLHKGNITLNEGHIQIIDWEAAIIAPKELDYARLKIELPAEQYNSIARVPLQEDLINLYIRLLQLSKTAYSTRFPEQDEKSKHKIEQLHVNWCI